MCHDLVKSISIDNLLNQREAVRENLATARTALAAVTDLCKALEGAHRRRLSAGAGTLVCDRDAGHYLCINEPAGLERAMALFDAAAWEHLLHASGMRSFMDEAARSQWDATIERAAVPELTRENVASTFASLYASRGEMAERGVIGVFQALGRCYKTNKPQMFGSRIVVRAIVGSTKGTDRMDDLLRVLYILDGKPQRDCRNGFLALLLPQRLDVPGRAGTVEDDYLLVKIFKNRNGHVTFKRPDLIERMNQIIAKHFPDALPAPR